MFWLLLQAPPIPDKITDQGLIVAALVIVLVPAVVIAVLKFGGDFWLKVRPSNGHKVVDGMSEVKTELRALSVQVAALNYDLRTNYHDRLAPALTNLAIAQLHQAGLHDMATAETKRVENLGEQERKT